MDFLTELFFLVSASYENKSKSTVRGFLDYFIAQTYINPVWL